MVIAVTGKCGHARTAQSACQFENAPVFLLPRCTPSAITGAGPYRDTTPGSHRGYVSNSVCLATQKENKRMCLAVIGVVH
jgi:hypothetical protein